MNNEKLYEELEAFKRWILHQTSADYLMYLDDSDDAVIRIETDFCRGDVIFYPSSFSDPDSVKDIIQLSVVNSRTENHAFFLHFKYHSQQHARKMFSEMLDTIKELKDRPSANILLCCTSGMTTGYFAEKLNESAELLGLNYHFSAVSYNNLFKEGGKFDLILLAPQVSFNLERVQEILYNKTVLLIPPRVFAGYDVMQTFELVKPYFEKGDLPRAESIPVLNIHPLPLKQELKISSRVLVISLLRWSTDEDFWFASRIYNADGSVLMDDTVIKHSLSMDDIYNICDTAFALCPDIQVVGIALPGIIDHGRVTLPRLHLVDTDVLDNLKARYSKQFILTNDANTLAVGYYISQDKYVSPSVIFIPFPGSKGGVGSLFKGQLIRGNHKIAGESQYLPVFTDDSKLANWSTPEEAIEVAARITASVISILSPDVIILCCNLIPRMDDVIYALYRYLPAKYIPDILRLDNLREYSLLGELALCAEALQQDI